MISYLQVNNISKSIGEVALFENISFGINKNEKMSIIAKNGTGKTTLLNIIAGYDSPDKGEITYNNEIRMGYLPQIPQLNDEHSILEEIFSAENDQTRTIKDYESALEKNDQNRISKAMEKMDLFNAWDYEVKAKQILTILALDDLSKPIHQLSGGQKKRVALAKTLIAEPNFLILDEPTNHLDLDMIEWLEDHLINTKSTILMVTHDRYFLDNVCNEIVEIDDNIIYQYKGNYSYFLKKRAERISQINTEAGKAQNLLRKETEWVKRMPKARGTKAKFRLDAYQELKKKAGYIKENDNLEITVQSERLGKKILNLDNVNKSFEDLTLIKKFSYKFHRFEKIGIIGKNGTGKSTFLNLITGQLKPDSGSIDTGQTIKFGYYRQSGLQFNENEKVIDTVRKIAEVVKMGNGTELSVTQFLNHFLFPPKTHYQHISKLSGGEKRRLYLLTILMQNPNFLILDEPTNDLDILTLNVLEEYLADFKGCVLIVSHDRYFMDKIVDHLFVFEGNGIIRDFPGNYSIYRQQYGSQGLSNKSQASVSKPYFSEKDADKSHIKRKTSSDNTSESSLAKGETSPASASDKNQSKGKKHKKLSYKEKHELEQVEQNLERLENEKSSLEDELNSGKLNADHIQEKSMKLADVLSQIEQKEMRWLELQEKEE